MERLIKRYRNRKLYDSSEGSYVTLDQLFNYIRQGDQVKVVDFAHISRKDVTEEVLLRMIFEKEEKKLGLSTEDLTSVIKNGDGTLSSFIAKIINK